MQASTRMVQFIVCTKKRLCHTGTSPPFNLSAPTSKLYYFLKQT
jgi:hypothetical protein